jgi:hypothetical protein
MFKDIPESWNDLLYDELISGFYRWIEWSYGNEHGEKIDAWQLPRDVVSSLGRRNELVSRIICEKGFMALRSMDRGLAYRMFDDASEMLPQASGYVEPLVCLSFFQWLQGMDTESMNSKQKAAARNPAWKELGILERLPEAFRPAEAIEGFMALV